MRSQHHPRPHERDFHYEQPAQESHEEEEEEDSVIYTARRTRSAHDLRRQSAARLSRNTNESRSTGLRALFGNGFGWRGKAKTRQITTAPGQLGAGETETEADEPPRHLPTTRILPASEPLIPPSILNALLFESSRLLSVVPAVLGACINAWCIYQPPGSQLDSWGHNHDPPRTTELSGWGRQTLPDRGDYFVAVLWTLLTAHQCLSLTTGLLHRWQAYYPPLSTLIRLLALQAICWPATHATLGVLGGLGSHTDTSFEGSLSILDSALLRWTTIRPDVCWAIIGTTTCISRSVQIWVTSNLLQSSSASSSSLSLAYDKAKSSKVNLHGAADELRKQKPKPSGRRWDWGVVGRACLLPAGCLYVVMAWVSAWRREVWGC
ncbi:hypothetical protein BV22DRAFT_1074726 [Leucogyrophana mollusca]|uniref:Uncharacterized protein n=1 Tax=Leucogyrophana mollusca TaxID=85980 RepID=A0ACB8B4X7_9AGAM|nr:hypothetical protein BV22DRAFT_1074726 [Leucogyrophana mollusca]